MEPWGTSPSTASEVSVRALLILALLCAAPVAPVLMDTPPASPAGAVVRTERAHPMARVTVAEPATRPVIHAYPPVRTSRPTIRIDAVSSHRALEHVRRTEGVVHAALVHVARVPVGPGPEHDTLVIGSVDPSEYRVLSPQVTADATDVWRRLDEGAVVVTHEHAARLQLDLGGTVWLGGPHGHDVRVGAIASNGVPPLAEAVVDRATGTRLGIDQVEPTILVATDESAVPVEVAQRLDGVAGEVSVIPDPRAPHAVTPHPPAGDTVWDVLAMCESSGDWQANTGNGFYGGLQFLPESWWLVGGGGLPHEASREEQIHRAELLLARQGWKAWPVCSVRVGLREGPVDLG